MNAAMPPDVIHAVVDRIVDGTAVLLVGDDEHEARVAADLLPPGAGEGAVLRVRAGDPLVIVGFDAEETARRRDAGHERLGRLRRTRGAGRFRKPGNGR